MYGGHEFYGDASKNQQSNFLDDNNNDEMLFASAPSHQQNQPPAATRAKEQYSPVKVWLHLKSGVYLYVCPS